MRLLEPGMLTVLVTSKCTAACRHCCMNSGPDRDEMLGYAELERILGQVFSELTPRVIVFTGGEPFLLGEDLVRAVRLCTDHGVATRVVTNAYWATSAQEALARLRPLREAGLGDINISTDDFHLPWISLQRVRHAFEAARALGFDVVVLSTCFGPDSAVTPARLNSHLGGGRMALRFKDDGEARLPNLEPGGTGLGMISNAHTQTLGRGAGQVLDDELFRGVPDGPDEGGCPWAVRWAAISPRGHFVSCCGFEVEGNPILDYGDLREHTLAELLDRADGDLITNAIAAIGPAAIKRVLERVCPDEISFRSSYRGMCEVCHDLVSIRRNRQALLRHQGVFAEAVLRIRERAEQAAQAAAPQPETPCRTQPPMQPER